jgi:uncharacterized membrane protein SpoIIM required for sporulation
MLKFVLAGHLRLAVHAALLFAVGLFASWPVVRYRLDVLTRPAEVVLRLVLRLMGPSPGLARMAGIIFANNCTVMFVCVAAGLHPMVPKVLCVWVGLNVGAMIGLLGRDEELLAPMRRRPGWWVPPPWATVLCSALVLLLELPCLWFAVAMGVSMGRVVHGGSASYAEALAAYARAYWSVIAPVLLVSAAAESVAVRGSFAPPGGNGAAVPPPAQA